MKNDDTVNKIPRFYPSYSSSKLPRYRYGGPNRDSRRSRRPINWLLFVVVNAVAGLLVVWLIKSF